MSYIDWIEMTKRLVFIDVAKGVAILLVVIGHIVQHNLVGDSAHSIFNFIYGFHMPLFFFLSGYVASLSRDNLCSSSALSFIKKKSISLLLPFLIWGVVVSSLFTPNLTIELFWDSTKNLLIRPDNGLWFLLTLFFIQLFFLLAILISNHIRIKRKVADMLSISLVLLLIAGGVGLPVYGFILT